MVKSARRNSSYPLVLVAAPNDYSTLDGTCVRDYIHVSDIADAYFRALAWPNSHGHQIKEVIAVAEKVCGRSTPIETASRRSSEPPILRGGCGDRRAGSLAGNLFIQIGDTDSPCVELDRARG
jgi:hypothetical protein